MNIFFKRCIIMSCLCYIGVSFAQHVNMVAIQSSSVNVKVIENSSQLSLNDSKSDQEQLIKQCLTFQPLLDKVPAEVRAQMDGYYILDHGIEFHFSSDFKILNKSVSLINKQGIRSNTPYFLFHTLHMDDKKALIRYNFNYTYEGVDTAIPMVIEFVKKNSLWEVLKNKK